MEMTAQLEILETTLAELGSGMGMVHFNGDYLEFTDAMRADSVLPFVMAEAESLYRRSGLDRVGGALPGRLCRYTEQNRRYQVALPEYPLAIMGVVIHFAAEAVLNSIRVSKSLIGDGVVDMTSLLRRHRYAIEHSIGRDRLKVTENADLAAGR